MTPFLFRSLRSRLLLLVFIAIIPALGLMLYRNVELRGMVVGEVSEEALRLAQLAASDQQDSIRDTRQLLFALAQLPQVRSGDPAACSDFFTQLLRQYPQYSLLGVIAPNGDIFCSAYPSSGPVNLADQSYFQRVLETRDFAISDYQTNDFNGQATLNFGYPVLDDAGQIQAVVFASLDLSWLNQLAAEAQLPEGSTFTVIDRNGTILVRYPDPEIWVGRSVPEVPIVEFIVTQRGEGTAEAVGIDGIPRLFAFTPLYGTPGGKDVYVSIGIPSSVAFADANRVLVRNLVGLGLVTALALTAAWFGSNWFILHWVNVLVSATKRLSAGDLQTRTGLPYDQGELSQLAHAFDDMAGALERRVAERNQAEEALRETQRALSTLLTNLPGMAYRCLNDERRTMEFVSEGCFDLTGFIPDQLIGSKEVPYSHLIHQDDRGPVWDQIQTALGEHKPFRLTYRLITISGEEKWVWEQGRGVYSSTGDLLALEGFITDATERVLAYQLLEQRVADRTRALSALYDVTAVASESLDLEMVLERSLERVLAVMGSRAGAIHFLDETANVLNLVTSHGLSADDLIQIASAPVGSSLVGWVIEQGKPVVVANLAASPRPLLVLPAEDSRAYVGVLMRAHGRALGVVSVIGEVGRCFNVEEVALLDSIADQVGVAVENARLYQQAEQLAVMKERSRLARDLHDSVTQSLYSATLLAEVGRRSVRTGNLERVEGYLAGLNEAVQQALKEMRLLIYELRPPVLEREGLVGALQQRLDAVEGRAGVETRLLVEETPKLSAAIEEGLYRIAQEALNNALKHAAATLVTVRLGTDDERVELEVLDNGLGFDPEIKRDQGGMGLINMRERAERLGGSLAILSVPGEGTMVKISVQTGDSQIASAQVTEFRNISEVAQ